MTDPARRYRTRRCTAAACGLRFPVAEGSDLGARCPACDAATELVDVPYVTHGIPPSTAVATGSATAPMEESGPPLHLEVLLDNIRSLRNVGSMFRTADGVGIVHLHLGGVTPTPAHPKLAKTALGAERTVPWSRHPDACAAAAALIAEGGRLWALEGGLRSVSLFAPEIAEAVEQLRATSARLVLVLGHEVSGVDPRIVDQCERVVHLPMLGHKDSLNVSVTLGVAAYLLRMGMGGRAPT